MKRKFSNLASRANSKTYTNNFDDQWIRGKNYIFSHRLHKYYVCYVVKSIRFVRKFKLEWKKFWNWKTISTFSQWRSVSAVTVCNRWIMNDSIRCDRIVYGKYMYSKKKKKKLSSNFKYGIWFWWKSREKGKTECVIKKYSITAKHENRRGGGKFHVLKISLWLLFFPSI